MTRGHPTPVVSGTLAYKKAKTVLQQKAHDALPKLRLDGVDCDNCWRSEWVGTLTQGNGDQTVGVDRQLVIMTTKFRELKFLLTSGEKLKWRLQHYVTGVLSTALHNVGG